MSRESSSEKLLYCSFCGKSQHEVRKLIAGPSVFICDECIELCNDIIREESTGDKGTKAATVLLGATLLGEPIRQHLPWVAAGIAGMGLLSLVFGYGDRKQCHKELAEQFIALRAVVELLDPEAATPTIQAAWEADFSRLNAKEPPALHALVTLCHNEQTLAVGRPENLQRLPLHRRLLASWVSFSAA